MKVNYKTKFFLDETKKISLHRDLEWDRAIRADIVMLSNRFIEFQKDLLNEFFADMTEMVIWVQDIYDLKDKFESSLQNLNTKLNVFADKLKDIDRLPIKWVVQIFFKWVFISSMIGDVSIVIFRNNKLNYIVDNEVENVNKIDIFSEIVEWDLETQDEILVAWINISEIFDKKDIEEALIISESEGREFMDVFEELATIRVAKEDIAFLLLSHIDIAFMINKNKIKESFFNKVKLIWLFKNMLVRFRYPVVITLVLIVILFLLYAFLTKPNSADQTEIIQQETWQFVVDFDMDDIRKDIDQFKKMPVSSDNKIKKYEEIKQKLDLLEEKNKWPKDVMVLKQVLNQEYFKWFNIALISSIEELTKYKFTDEEKSSLWSVMSITELWSSWWIVVWGKKWAIVGAISDKVRWKIINYNLPIEMDWCASNLMKNGTYCYSKTWEIFNLTKGWMESVTTKSWKFPKDIKDVDTYKRTSFYVLSDTDNLMSNKWFVTRYDNVMWYQTKFSEWKGYIFAKKFFEANKVNFSSWFSNFFIDPVNGTMMMWSIWNKKLYQMWRDQQTLEVNWRIINLEWWNKLWNWFSSDVRVIKTGTSNYLFLYDKTNQLLTVYQSTPFKTNSSYYHDFTLKYFFSIKFDLTDNKIKDLSIDTSDKPKLYFVTESGVYQIKLYEYFNTFNTKQ